MIIFLRPQWNGSDKAKILKEKVDLLNKKFGKKLLFISLYVALTLIFCALFNESAEKLSIFAANYFPSVNKLRSGTEIGMFPAHFFGISAILIPIYATWLLQGEDLIVRISYTSLIYGKSIISMYLFILIMGAPLLTLFCYISYEANLSMEYFKNHHRANWIYRMFNSYPELVAYGGFNVVFVSGCLAALILIYSVPVLAIKNYLTKE